MIINKITINSQNVWILNLIKPTSQNSIKEHIRKRYFKTLGTSVICKQPNVHSLHVKNYTSIDLEHYKNY